MAPRISGLSCPPLPWALGLAVPAAEFIVELQYRLCMDQEAGDFCPLCDTILDNRGHHCRQCSAGGDRTIRHNGVRNEVLKFCHNEAAIHQAELEKPAFSSQPALTTSNKAAVAPLTSTYHGGMEEFLPLLTLPSLPPTNPHTSALPLVRPCTLPPHIPRPSGPT